MQRIAAKSLQANQAYALVVALQQQFVERMEAISQDSGSGRTFEPVEWFRESGRHGGGIRYVADDKAVFNQASVNVSQVQYDADETKSLASATALSSIIHPNNPLMPSMHLHVSWTEMKNGHGYWRVMADLNPAIECSQHTMRFRQSLEAAASHDVEAQRQGLDDQQLAAAFAQGDRYFHIPVLNRHRGVCHFYLENFYTDNHAADLALAERVISATIETYAGLFDRGDATVITPTLEDYTRQLAYHSLYFFQVLTLDRGTTSGLLVHDQNDVGILGSLPSYVDKNLITSWQSAMPEPQDKLVARLLDCLPPSDTAKSVIDESVKCALAGAVRAHYKEYPEALALQASGGVIPPTVSNHRSAVDKVSNAKAFHIPITESGITAVDCLAGASGLSKQLLKQAMQKGCVWLEQHSARGDDKQFVQRLRRAKRVLKSGETLHFYYDEVVLSAVPSEATLVSDEGSYSVWHKPAGMRSQGSKWGDHCTLYRWSEQHLLPERPAFIVHRLDRAASGLMLLAHKKQVTSDLTRMFAKRQIEKCYQVKVEGNFSTLLAADEQIKSIRTNVDSKPATSHVKHLSYDDASDESLLEVQIETGRKHQIRVHLASVGYPVVGDRLHGSGKQTKDLQLAAVSLKFLCPVTGEAKSFATSPTFAV